MDSDLLFEPEVKQLSRLSGTTRWRLEKEGKFPKRFRIGLKRVAWSRAEVLDWLAERMREREQRRAA